ncbi:glycosyltransferase family 4 protein [Candidatus Parcubacteria bacterium]|nr:glycosyltransferase family 4 protein [Candidatus Parcubacteria bacterium]
MKNSNGILIATGIFPPDIGGPASYAHTLATRLSDQPISVVTYSSILKSESPIRVIRIWNKLPKGLKHLVYFFNVFKEASNCRTILALNAVTAGVPAALVAQLRKKRFFVKIVGDYAWEIATHKGKTSLLINDFQKSPRSGMVGLLHRLQVWTTKKADGVIVPSEYLSSVVQGWGVPASKVHVIYNGAKFNPVEMSKEEARKQLGISGNVILTVGRLVPWKGFRMLIKLMPKLSEVNQFFRLVIVGEGPDRRTLELMIKHMGLDRKVVLAGQKTQTELAVYCAAADMFILNSGYEGFSHQILEAMIAGVPVIASAIGGNKEVIHQGENGFMVKYNDEFNIVEAVRTLWTIPELRERFITEGKKTAAYFSVEKMFDETIKLLTHV